MNKVWLVALVLIVAAVLLAANTQENTCVVNADTLSIQDKPDGSEIAVVHSGDTLSATGEYKRDPFPGMGVWMEVSSGDVTGWVDQRYCG